MIGLGSRVQHKKILTKQSTLSYHSEYDRTHKKETETENKAELSANKYNKLNMPRVKKRILQSRAAGRLGGRPNKRESKPETSENLTDEKADAVLEEIQLQGKFSSS